VATSNSPLAAASRMRRTRTAFSGSFESVLPIRMIEGDREQGVARKGRPDVRRTMLWPGVWAAGTMSDHPRRDLMLPVERPQHVAI